MLNSTNILIGIMPALGWGLQGVVMQKIGGTTANKQMGMVIATLCFAVTFFIFSSPTTGGQYTSTVIIAALINGIGWAIGQILQIKSFEYIGVARAAPISTGTQLSMTLLVSIFVFKEWTETHQFVYGILALLVLIIGVSFTSYQEKKSSASGGNNFKKGLICLLISSAAFTIYATAGHFYSVNSGTLLLPQAIVMFMSTTIICSCMLGRKNVFDKDIGVFGKKSWINILTGICFAIANFTILISIERNGVAVGWTLSQMNVIIATLGGLLILREKKTKKELTFVLCGLVLVALGGVFVGLTKI